MCMRVDKPGNNSLSLQVYFLGIPGSKRLQFFIGAGGKETAFSDGDCFGARLTIVDGDDVSVVKNQLRLDAIQW